MKGVGRKWNLVPQWDNLADGPAGPERSQFGTVGEAARWKNGLPEGIIHWTGYAKPWHYESQGWRPDLWESEETSWGALRSGWWEKPLCIEISPRTEEDVTALARRVWKVDAVSDPVLGLKGKALPYPDVHWLSVRAALAKSPRWLGRAAMVRFGPGVKALPWLQGGRPLPECVVLQGPVTATAARAVIRLGYSRLCRITRAGWPGSGGGDRRRAGNCFIMAA